MIETALVVGAGIGGLACAAALAQRGVAVTVFEQAPEIREVGAGLQVSPNGLAVLRALGLEKRLDAQGAVVAQAVVLADYKAGKEVARLDLGRLAPQRYLFVHRHDLIATLADAARAAGVTVRLGAQVEAIEPGPVPNIRLAGGEVASADIVIAADGVHSVGRGVVASASEAAFTGQIAWRAMIPAHEPLPEACVTMGPGRHLVSYPLREGRLMNLVAIEERSDWTAEGWHHVGDADALRAAFAGFGGASATLLDKVEDVGVWGLFRHPVADCWIKGNVALLGDAAHPTLPFLAQGANLALEDAWVLADCLIRGDAADRYQRLRRERVRKVIDAASGNAWKYHLRDGMLRQMAHLGLSLGSRLVPGLMMRQFDWIYGHDVTRR